MRLFLASYRTGGHDDEFLSLLHAPPGSIGVIANATDAWSPAARSSAVASDVLPLRRLGFAPVEVDLRDFVDDAAGLAATLAGFPALWVRGGNTFVLRAQLARSGGDGVLRELLAADSLVYAGYSAGACVLAPSLHGLESLDDPSEVGDRETRWDGLGIIDRPIVPHVDSILDDTGAAGALAARLGTSGPVWALRDDQVVVVCGGVTRLLS